MPREAPRDLLIGFNGFVMRTYVLPFFVFLIAISGSAQAYPLDLANYPASDFQVYQGIVNYGCAHNSSLGQNLFGPVKGDQLSVLTQKQYNKKRRKFAKIFWDLFISKVSIKSCL